MTWGVMLADRNRGVACDWVQNRNGKGGWHTRCGTRAVQSETGFLPALTSDLSCERCLRHLINGTDDGEKTGG